MATETVGSVAEMGYRGVDQWVMVRGKSLLLRGRRDRWVPAETSVTYIESLTAPSKRLVWFERSGHEPFVDEPAKFNALMAELVRPAIRHTGGVLEAEAS